MGSLKNRIKNNEAVYDGSSETVSDEPGTGHFSKMRERREQREAEEAAAQNTTQGALNNPKVSDANTDNSALGQGETNKRRVKQGFSSLRTTLG